MYHSRSVYTQGIQNWDKTFKGIQIKERMENHPKIPNSML